MGGAGDTLMRAAHPPDRYTAAHGARSGLRGGKGLKPGARSGTRC